MYCTIIAKEYISTKATDGVLFFRYHTCNYTKQINFRFLCHGITNSIPFTVL